MESDTSSSDDLSSSLSSIGIEYTFSAQTRYVVHTSSIPLASTFNSDRVHNERIMEKIAHHCVSNCSYRDGERVHEKCPCREINRPHVCFLEALKDIGTSNLNPGTRNVEPSEYAYCMDSKSIFDKNYSRNLRELIGVKGWDEVKPVNLIPLCNNLYWYHKHRFRMNLNSLFKQGSLSDSEYLQCFKQTIYTLNGLLVKRFLTTPSEMASYSEIGFQTARLFSLLFKHYLLETDDPAILDNSPYLDIKGFLQFVKKSFHHEDARTRHYMLLEYPFKFDEVKEFFPEVRKVFELVLQLWNEREEDYTTSPAWIYRWSTFAQTRVIGYMPKALSKFQGKKYREFIDTPAVKPDMDVQKIIYKSMQEELRYKGVAPHLLGSRDGLENLFKSQNELLQSEELIKTVVSNMEFVVKQSASVKQTVKEGGKLEDARRAVWLIKEYNLQIPVRNLVDHSIVKYITISKSDTSPDYHAPLFWFSYQLMLNHLISLKEWDRPEDYHVFNCKEEYRDPTIFAARIAIIKEPGKDRYLTMSNSYYTWVLTPAGKILNAILALIPEHTVGLKGATDGWSYNQDIGPDAADTGFIYNLDGSAKKTYQYFVDWIEATDNINRYIGMIMVKAIMDYSDFPHFYKRLVLTILGKDQDVVQTLVVVENEIREFINWRGKIANGFMMGNPITKTILHSCHIVDTNRTRAILGNEVKETDLYWQKTYYIDKDKAMKINSQRLR